MGAEIFPLYFLASSRGYNCNWKTYNSRNYQESVIAAGIEVLYGDTDSLFIKNPTDAQIQQVIEDAKKDHGVDLEIDKEYRYVVLSNRKKNYLGVTKSGKVDVKGLTGKKSHTPKFIKNLFYELLDVLAEVQNIKDFENAKKQISVKISDLCQKGTRHTNPNRRFGI